MIISDLQYLEVVDDKKTSFQTNKVKGGLVAIGSFAFATATAQDFAFTKTLAGTVSLTFSVK